MNGKKAAQLTFHQFKRANRGLYGESSITFGDKVSEMGNRTRRSFKPNVQYISLFSEHMGKTVKVRAAVEVIRKVDEAGGLDNYLLGQRFPESWGAEKIRYDILMAKHRAECSNEVKSPNGLFNAA